MDELTGWGAISGQVMAEDGTIYAVSDSFYGMQPTIFHIDVSESPARIVNAIRITREGQPAQLMDLEGIAMADGGGFWVASEGRTDRLRPHAIYYRRRRRQHRRLHHAAAGTDGRGASLWL